MSNHDLPRGFVALPEAVKLTDTVSIDSLGLPVGFDEERLGVNVRGLDGVRRLISADVLRITCESSTSLTPIFSGSVHEDGSLAASSTASAEKRASSSGGVAAKTASVKMDSATFDEQYPDLVRQVRSPSARATLLNKAIRPGLSEAALKSLEINSLFWAGYTASVLAVANAAAFSDGFTPGDVPFMVGINPFLWMLYARESGKKLSLLPFWPVDRYAIASGKIATTKFFGEITE